MSGPDRVPIGAEARGKLRLWKRAALARYRRIEAVLAGRAFERAARDFNHKRGIGRQRAFFKLKAMLAEACPEEVNDGFALWSYLRPRESVVCPSEGVKLAELQDCVCVDYLAVGRTWDHGAERVTTGRGQGLWSFEASDHALGRCLQRGTAPHDLDAVIRAGHRGALAMRTGDGADFLIPAGNGSFLCSLRGGPDQSTGLPCVWVSARTWIHADMASDRVRLAARSCSPSSSLGASLLLPLALRHLAADAPEIRP
jgi:hypothetical protein